MPNRPPPGPGTFRLWMVAGLMVLIAGFAAITQIDGLQAEDAAATGDKPTTTTTDADPTSTTDDTDDSTTTSASASGDDAPPPLPGDDWGPEAREAFVSGCVSEPTLVGASVLTSMSPEEICGCMYDRIESSDIGLDDFNEVWTSSNVEAIPVDNPAKAAMSTAATDCAVQGLG